MLRPPAGISSASRHAVDISLFSRSPRSAWFTATSEPARSTRCANAFTVHTPLSPTPANILGVLSLIFWSLIIVISIKYLVFVLHADNHGEGGILSLTALATPIKPSGKSERWMLIVMGIFGAALLYGEGVITPAISILGAMEGLTVATPLFNPYVVPITIAIIVALFLFQSRGTAGIGKMFGPVMLVWFAVLAVLGIMQIVRYPEVLAAINPLHGVDFFLRNGWHGFLILGSVFLVVTGGEALYADMGHFGMRPIRLAWFTVVLPALLAELFWSGCTAPGEPGRRGEPFLPPGTLVGTLPDGHPGDGCGGDRLASCNHRRVLARHAGRPTRFHPASEDHPHVDQRVWADIHSHH